MLLSFWGYGILRTTK